MFPFSVFFCNVTSLGIVCISWGKNIKVIFFAILWSFYIIHVLQYRLFWVNYFGASLFSYWTHRMCIFLLFLFYVEHSTEFCCNWEIWDLITCPWGNWSLGRSNSYNYFPCLLFPYCSCVSGQALTPSISRWKPAVTKVHLLELKLALLFPSPQSTMQMLKSSPFPEVVWLECGSASLTQFLYYHKMVNMQKWEDEP